MKRYESLLLLVLAVGCREPASVERELELPVGVEPVVGPIEAEPQSQSQPQPTGPMVEVPAGEFTRGTDVTEIPELVGSCSTAYPYCEQGLWAETPIVQLQLPSFWIDRHEVSNAEYEQCVASGNCAVRRLWQCTREHPTGPQPVDDPSPYLDPDQPAVCVSHGEAAGYCFSRGARLPSRSEWEKAARGSDGRRYPWGDDPPTCERGNFPGCGRTAGERVGSYPDHPSPFGALDLAGNVAEWVMPDVGPDGMYEQGGDAEVRGGHFAGRPVDLRAAARMFLPSTQERMVEVGFRCAADPDRAQPR